MCALKNKVMNLTWKMRIAGVNMLAKKDSGESHVITVIAMCVIGVALVTVLSTSLKPVIETLAGEMQTKITAMFTAL
ncbi:MAG: hypothetical protein IJ471_09310 [Eubacterium sp.]|nr:hypothetical protein [Eubacterium sp.]